MKVFTIYGGGGNLGHVTDHLYKLSSPLAKEAPHEILLIGHAVSEKMFEIVDDNHNDNDDRRQIMGILLTL